MRTGLHRIVAACASLAAPFLLVLPASAQCAMCNTAGGASNVGRGLSVSVLFLLGTLGLVVLGFVLLVVVRAYSPEKHPADPGNVVEGPA